MSVNSQYPSSFPARIAFIGEAPGADEVDKGMPLVGASGRVFNSILRTANLDRAEFFVGNVFDEKIPDNDIKHWTASATEAREKGFADEVPLSSGYLRPAYRHHLDRLRNELRDVKPNVIVPLGSTALWAVTGETNITAHRGSIQAATRLVPGVKVLPTYHPAFVMRQWKFFPVVVADILRAYAEGAYPEVIIPEKQLFIEPTLEDFEAYIPSLLESDALSVDIETGWGQITSIGFAPDSTRAICVPFVDLRRPNRSYWNDAGSEVKAWRLVKSVMEHNVPKLGQNFGGYDAYWLLMRMGIEPRNFIYDTRLLHHALYPELPKDLEFMGASYTTQGSWKSWGHKAQEKRDS